MLHLTFIFVSFVTSTPLRKDLNFLKKFGINISKPGISELFFDGSIQSNFKPLTPYSRKSKLPKNFDSRKKWPECKSIVNAFNPGRCLAEEASMFISTLNDRECIKLYNSTNRSFEYSAEDLFTCCTNCLSEGSICENADYFFDCFNFWLAEGIVSGGGYKSKQGCKPYSEELFTEAEAEKDCQQKCTNPNYKISYEKDKKKGYTIRIISESADDVKKEIYKNGPVLTTIAVSEDFFYHENKYVVEQDFPAIVGFIPAKFIGWKQVKDKFYWLVYFPQSRLNNDTRGVYEIQDDALFLENIIFAPQVQPVFLPNDESTASRDTKNSVLIFILTIFFLTIKFK